MRYIVEQKIHTLVENAVMAPDIASFGIDGITFSHWDFSYGEGWKEDAWLSAAVLEAPNYGEAYSLFHRALQHLIPRIAFIGQCYSEYLSQPFLIRREDSDLAFFRYTRNRGGVGLMFMEDQLEALRALSGNTQLPNEFFYYWNDAVNTTGFTPKLLLMFSAIEALVKKPSGKKDWDKIEAMLGPDLKKTLYGTKDAPECGLRHRLTHGEYFNESDVGVNYLDHVHGRIVRYFNDRLFGKKLISEAVVQPQRHFVGTKEELKVWIKRRTEFEGAFPNLQDALKDYDPAHTSFLRKYQFTDNPDAEAY